MQTVDLGLGSEHGWNALRTRYQHETTVSVLLGFKGFRTFLPTYDVVRRWKDRKKHLTLPLFAGYLFVEDVGNRKLEVVNTAGACSLVCVGGVPAIIPNEEITAVQLAVESKYWLEPHPFLSDGEAVRVKAGPLCGVEGILLRKKDCHKLLISIRMLGRSAAVEIDSTLVERISTNSDYQDSSLMPLERKSQAEIRSTAFAGTDSAR